jgi:hypothetical protein
MLTTRIFSISKFINCLKMGRYNWEVKQILPQWLHIKLIFLVINSNEAFKKKPST